MDSSKAISNQSPHHPITRSRLPTYRLYLMRGLYLLTFIGLVYENWLAILFPSQPFETLSGVAISFWASYALLMGLGVRYPIQMIPLLLLQLLYKSAWLIGTYRPASTAEMLNEDLTGFFWICVTAIILDILVIPWSFVYRQYAKDFFKWKITA